MKDKYKIPKKSNYKHRKHRVIKIHGNSTANKLRHRNDFK
jgi:hypothetical protein